jgi:hypothetical protein
LENRMFIPLSADVKYSRRLRHVAVPRSCAVDSSLLDRRCMQSLEGDFTRNKDFG